MGFCLYARLWVNVGQLMGFMCQQMGWYIDNTWWNHELLIVRCEAPSWWFSWCKCKQWWYIDSRLRVIEASFVHNVPSEVPTLSLVCKIQTERASKCPGIKRACQIPNATTSVPKMCLGSYKVNLCWSAIWSNKRQDSKPTTIYNIRKYVVA